MKQSLLRNLSVAVLISFGACQLPVQAAMLSTESAMSSQQALAERSELQAFLQRDDVVKAMQSQGLDAQEAVARVAMLSDDEVHAMHGKINQLPAGGDVLGLLFTVFVILLVTDILGLTKVFNFTRSIRH